MTPVSYMFQKMGRIRVSLRPDQAFQDLWDEAVEGGAQEVEEMDVEHAATEGRTAEVSGAPFLPLTFLTASTSDHSFSRTMRRT